jgi:shikimate dehydrogenase
MDMTSSLTRLVPILAHPAVHVRAPAFYNPAFAAAGLNWLQVVMDVAPEQLGAVLGGLARVGNVQGLNITIPHKAAAVERCAQLGPHARATGVVNTLRLEADGSWSGEMFDGVGFVGAASAHGVLDAKRAVLLVGTGGAGTAIACALADAGVRELQLIDSDAAKVEQLAQRLQRLHPSLRITTEPRLHEVGLAINATPLGHHATDPLPLDPARLPPDAAVFDITASRDTELMADARALGLRVVGGRAMVEHQIAAQINFWRGSNSNSDSTLQERA